jgi:CubicO group peptidase (beta-lactamase class C family)
MRLVKSTGILAIVLAVGVFAQQRAVVQPPARGAAGVSTERLAKLDGALQKYVDDKRVAGLVVLALRDGRPIYEKAFGWSDQEAGRRMETDIIFRIASQTKALTSVAIMQLVEDGKISLSNPVSQFIPAYAKTTVLAEAGGTPVPARRAITIRDLLTHTAGISYGTDRHLGPLYEAKGLGPAAGRGWYTADKDEPVCDTMERLATLPFLAQPGESYVYGYNTDILGCVVERASGMPLDKFFESRITGPLGMKDTHFFLPAEQKPRLAAVYTSGPDGALLRSPAGGRGQGDYVEGPRRNFSGGAGLLSTARDYARFLEALRRGGTLDGVRILSPRTVALMTTNQLGTMYSNAGRGFGLGFETVDRYGAAGLQSVGSWGWGGAYGSSYRVDPVERLVMVSMVQVFDRPSDITEKFQTLVYQALDEQPARSTSVGSRQ